MNKIKLLWEWLSGYRSIYLISIISIAIATFLSFIWPIIFRITIDSLIGDMPIEMKGLLSGLIKYLMNFVFTRDTLSAKLYIIAGILLLLTLLQGLFQFWKGKYSAVASERFAENLRNRLYSHLQNLSFQYHANAKIGDLIQRCTSDIETIRRFLSAQVSEIGRAIFMIIFALSFMLSMSVKMTFISMLLIPIIIIFAYVFFKKVQIAFKRSDEAEGDLSAILQENLSGIKVVKAFAKQDFVIKKYDKANIVYRDLTYILIRLLAIYWSVSDFTCLIQIGMVLIIGTYWTMHGQITLGTLLAFSSYVGMLLWPVRQMGRVLTDMGKAFVSIDRINDILNEDDEYQKKHVRNEDISGNIEFKNVGFRYGEKVILKNISFDIKQGETLAILGHTGSGKTTLVNFLIRLLDYNFGSIKIDGLELKEIDKKSIRKKIGIVLQNPFIFSGSVRDNIGIAKDDCTDEEIVRAARMAKLHNDITRFKNKYETFIGEKGVTLSGGQKQRLAIARILLNDYKVLIFDDSLSAVDTETDEHIRNAILHEKSDVTKIIISHRLSTLAHADKIIVLKHGELIQQGTHKELLQQTGLYRKIWHIQNEIEDEIVPEIELEIPGDEDIYPEEEIITPI